MNKNKGINIIELAMSIMIVSIAILMIIGIYTNIIRALAKGIGKTVASPVAERIMQDIANNKISEIKKKIDMNSETTDYKYELIGKDIINDNIYYYYSTVYKINADTNLYQLDIVVYYNLNDNITEETIKKITDIQNSVKFSRLITFSDD